MFRNFGVCEFSGTGERACRLIVGNCGCVVTLVMVIGMIGV